MTGDFMDAKTATLKGFLDATWTDARVAEAFIGEQVEAGMADDHPVMLAAYAQERLIGRLREFAAYHGIPLENETKC